VTYISKCCAQLTTIFRASGARLEIKAHGCPFNGLSDSERKESSGLGMLVALQFALTDGATTFVGSKHLTLKIIFSLFQVISGSGIFVI